MIQWHFFTDVLGLSLIGVFLMVLGIVTLLQNPRSHIHHAFAGSLAGLYVLAMLEILRLASFDPELHLLTYRLTFAVAIMVIATALYFSQVFPDDPELPTIWREIIFFIAAGAALVTLFSPRVIAGFEGAVVSLGDHTSFRGGDWYPGLRLFLLSYLLAAVYSLAIKWRAAQGVQRIKLAHIITAIFVSGGIPIAALYLFPIWHFHIHRVIPLAITLGVLIALRGILRYRLFRVMPYAAAEELLNSLGDTILVVDLEGRIVLGRIQAADELEPLLKPVVEMVIGGKKVGNYNINFKGRYYSLTARFINEGGGVLVILNDISEIERSLTEQDLIREKLVKRLEKETIIRRTLSALAQVKEEDEIRSIIPPVEISSDPELMQAIDRLEKATRNRLELLAKSQSDRRELLAKVEEAERVYNAGVQRELEVVELREKIRKLKEAKGIQ